MHSVILDHYTQCPFNNTCHQRYSSRPYQASDAKIETRGDTPTEEPPPPTMSSVSGQSVLTWSPSQVLMTSPLVNWTPYLVTMATNPTAKYSLDLQLSCTRSDSGFEDNTMPPAKDLEDVTTPPKHLEDTSAPTLEHEDDARSHKAATMLPSRPDEAIPPGPKSQREPNEPPSQSKHFSLASSIVDTRQSTRRGRVPPIASKPASPKVSRPSSRSDHGMHHHSNPSMKDAMRTTRPSSTTNEPTYRLSTRSTDPPVRTSQPISSRRSSTLPVRRTASRTDSFILSRNEPRPIDFASVVQRTREQQHSDPSTCNLFQPPEDPENEAQSPAPSPQNTHDYPIDWTSPDSRAAQYAEIDRKKKGITGLWRKLRRKLKLGKGEMDFYEGGSDVGSVRRYRLDPDYGHIIEREFAAMARKG